MKEIFKDRIKAIGAIALIMLFCLLFFWFMSLHAHAQTKYLLKCKATLLITSDSVLKAQVGVKEKTGNNDGKQIELYQKSVGRHKGDAYCAAGQYYCFKKATEVLYIKSSEIPILRTGLANGIFYDAKKRGVQSSYIPAVNDLIIWKEVGAMTGHVERIIKVLENGFVITVGFNTSNGKSGSQKEGNGVFIRLRNIYHPLSKYLLVNGLVGFIRQS